MATAQPSKEVTTVQVGSVSFGWYSDDEARSVNIILSHSAKTRPPHHPCFAHWRWRHACRRRACPQIRRLSVKKIVNPFARDNLGNALPGGLLDPAMGPTEPHAS